MKKKWKVIKSNNLNYYLFSPRKEEQLLLLHPIISYLLTIEHLNEWFEKLRKDSIIRIEKVGDISYDIIDFYLKKIEFLKKNGLFDSVDSKLAHVTENQIESNIYGILYLAFEVTESCNLKCDYCIYSSFYSNINRNNSRLDFTTGKKVIDKIFEGAENGVFPYEFSISFYGGEPLMNFNFIRDVVNYVKVSMPEQKFRFAMTTNAMLLDKYMSFLIENNFELLISLDGNEENNKYRKKLDGNKSYEKVFCNIKTLKDKHPVSFNKNVEINSVTKDENKESVIEFIKKEFDLTPSISLFKTFNVNPDKKTEFYKEFYNSTEKDIFNEDNEKNIRKFLFGLQYNSFNELYNAELLIEKKQITNFPLQSMTCIPFERKMYITSKKNIFHCDKVAEINTLGPVVEKDNKIFDVKRITTVTNNFIDKVKNICDNCYNDYCPVCLHSEEVRPDQQCKYFISDIEYYKNISIQISNTENRKVSL